MQMKNAIIAGLCLASSASFAGNMGQKKEHTSMSNFGVEVHSTLDRLRKPNAFVTYSAQNFTFGVGIPTLSQERATIDGSTDLRVDETNASLLGRYELPVFEGKKSIYLSAEYIYADVSNKALGQDDTSNSYVVSTGMMHPVGRKTKIITGLVLYADKNNPLGSSKDDYIRQSLVSFVGASYRF